jgi:hypothetical protein
VSFFFGFSRYRTHSKFSVVFHPVWDIGRGLDDTHAYTLSCPAPLSSTGICFPFILFQWDSFRIQVGYGVMVSIDKTRAIHTHTRTTRGGGVEGPVSSDTDTNTTRKTSQKFLTRNNNPLLPFFFFSTPLPTVDGRMECLSRRKRRVVGGGGLFVLFVFFRLSSRTQWQHSSLKLYTNKA